MTHAGEAAAVATSLLWAVTAILFTAAGRRVGSWAVNFARLPLAVLLLGGTLWALTGSPLPSAGAREHLWLGLSGITGLTLGDAALFAAFTAIGPRRALLVMSTAPIVTLASARLLLGERPGPLALAGIAVIVSGVALAALGRDDGGDAFRHQPPAVVRRGWIAAFLGAAGQGLGATFAKMGMRSLEPLPATLLRMTWATLGLLALTLAARRLVPTVRALAERAAWPPLLGGVVVGPFLGVWMSLVAIRHAEAGVAQALMGTTPVTILIPSWIVYRDRPRPTAVLGAAITVAGGALLFLR